jgi:hypothetical protein
LIPQQKLKRNIEYLGDKFDLWDERIWVWGCVFHHTALDQSRRLRLPRSAIPEGCEEFADRYGYTYFLDEEYGE